MSKHHIDDVYLERIRKCNEAAGPLKKWDLYLSVLKVVLFFGGFILLVALFPGGPLRAVSVFGIFFLIFAVTAVVHESKLKKIKYYRDLVEVNEREITLLSHRFVEEMPDGSVFNDSGHPYTSDLDIFGPHSLFHYLNRAVTSLGRKRIAKHLREPGESGDIRERQRAVKELAGKIDFRQHLQVHGLGSDDRAGKLETLYQLFQQPAMVLGKKGLLFFIYFFPAVTLAMFGLIAVGVPVAVPLFLMFVQLAINKYMGKRVAVFYDAAAKNKKILRAYYRIIGEIESQEFEPGILTGLRQRLSGAGRPASFHIKRLSVLMDWFETRYSGMLHFLLNNSMFFDLHCICRIEKWKTRTADVMEDWFEVIAEVEALASLGNLCFNHPGWVFPVISGDRFRLVGRELGHPLIPQGERVCNDVRVEDGHILVITGPNMAGKSTFLRTVGVNAVLAFAGAPVCAAELEISPFQLFTSMQASDSLDKHLSLFYSELQRLKMIMGGLSEHENGFFMVDEMLKGTNALDRQKGAIVLVKQLLKQGAHGIVATHDLELAKLDEEEANVFNFHFDGDVKDDKLVFSYKLTPGVCQSFNAVALMRLIGIEV